MPPMTSQQRIEALLAQTARPNGDAGCWIYTGRTNWKGYGEVKVGGSYKKAHRVVYEYFRGPIPAGLVSDHLCRVRNCINPAHIEPVTPAENRRRGAAPGASLDPARDERLQREHQAREDRAREREERARQRTARAEQRQADAAARATISPAPRRRPETCPSGHPYTPENTKHQTQQGRVIRRCLTCLRAKKAAEKRKMRAARSELRKAGALPVFDLGPLEPGDPRHGTLRGFIRHRCRCPECVAAEQCTRRGATSEAVA